MITVLDKPGIRCRFRNAEAWQCPPDALEDGEYCKFHLPK